MSPLPPSQSPFLDVDLNLYISYSSLDTAFWIPNNLIITFLLGFSLQIFIECFLLFHTVLRLRQQEPDQTKSPCPWSSQSIVVVRRGDR